MKTFIATICIATWLVSPVNARTRIVVLPPGGAFAPELKHELAEAVVGLPVGDDLHIYSSRPIVAPIASITRPTDPTLNRARVKAMLAAQFKPVLEHIAAAPPGSGAESLLVPNVIEQLARDVPRFAETGADVLLIGPWLYADRDQRTAMIERAVPGDRTLYAPRSEWPFSVIGAETRLARSALFFCWPDGANAFDSDRHEFRVRRWWSIWTTAQSGKVGAMSFSLKTCFSRFNAGDTSGQPVYPIQKDGKPEMQRVSEAIPLVLPASFENPGLYFLKDDMPLSRTQPAATKGVVYAGIRWSAPCDFDLYGRADPQSQWVYFGNPKTAEAVFDKDWLGAPGDGQYETILFKEVRLDAVELAVDLFSCSAPAPPEGKLRIWFDRRVWEVPFKFGVREGNRGTQPMIGGAWVRFGPLAKLLGKD